jgi:transcriptional regulator with XRE-family HTH domain
MSVSSGERLVAARLAVDVTQETLAAHSGFSQGLISQWERDLKTPIEHSARKIQETLAKLRMIQQRHAGVKIDMNDVKFIRKELRKLDGGAKEIEQVWGSEFISRFCNYARLTVPEFLAMAQLRRTIGEAAVVSPGAALDRRVGNRDRARDRKRGRGTHVRKLRRAIRKSSDCSRTSRAKRLRQTFIRSRQGEN